MAKVKIVRDSFEQISELGKSTAKNTVKQTIETFSPLNILEGISTKQKTSESKDKKEDKHTPLNIEGLEKEFDKQDKVKEESLRNRLFKLVKSGEEQEIQKKKAEQRQKEVEDQEIERQKEVDKKRNLAQTVDNMPQGKVRKSIFSPKVKARREHLETKPSVGKS